MTSATADFDAFCDGAWDPLLLQTFAACGDLAVARDSLERALVDAWHHWPRATWQGPESYVRQAALRRAAWRIRTHPFHRSQRLTRDQRSTLQALDTLSLPARRAVVLSSLSTLDPARIAHETGETLERTTALVAAGREGVASALGVPAEMVATRLHGLAGAARSAQRPVPSRLREHGRRRRRAWLGGGVVAALVLTVLGGLYVHADSGPAETLPPAVGPEVSTKLLLSASDLAPLGTAARWTVVATGAVTGSSGARSVCQTSRLADPDGLRAYARTFRFGSGQRAATQTLQLSRTERQARAAYRRALDWFDDCSSGRLQVLSAYDVSGLGDDATVLRLRQQTATGSRLSSYAVGIARTGHILTWTALTVRGAQAPATTAVVTSLATSIRRACASSAAGSCREHPVAKEVSDLESGEAPGMLTTADLPSVPGVSSAWRGTDAQATTTNAAATTCDRTNFASAGSTRTTARTFLTPGAKVPTRFGVTETLGRFPTPAGAKGLVAQVVDRLATCQNRDPGAKVGPTAQQVKGPHGTSWYLWRVTSDISAKRSVTFWMGIARYGVNVVQVGFVPGNDGQDLTAAGFQSLVERARDRLLELPGNGQ
ncbi:hypothetical protein D9V37_09245 [Nocardioides mangrovicus]|uniref:DNA-directed RNA polymerase specialized sigma24 family protein n=1 Tax=Nocardioides mangrovicus TaxID=2478913 RepID=A0A3L8P3S5_9ACTN|nr:hypothetical protein [Nocardioides mangrovicus]RLV50040.1 hypothetical protein D9V37_09245 [Nocardioides mangrovicus]